MRKGDAKRREHPAMRRIDCLYPGEKQFCPYRLNEGSCKQTVHHLYYPRREYKSKFLSDWRNSIHHKVLVCRGLHDVLHLCLSLPKRPYTHHIEGGEGYDVRDEPERETGYEREP